MTEGSAVADLKEEGTRIMALGLLITCARVTLAVCRLAQWWC